jgi:hypothetical protein
VDNLCNFFEPEFLVGQAWLLSTVCLHSADFDRSIQLVRFRNQQGIEVCGGQNSH